MLINYHDFAVRGENCLTRVTLWTAKSRLGGIGSPQTHIAKGHGQDMNTIRRKVNQIIELTTVEYVCDPIMPKAQYRYFVAARDREHMRTVW